MTAPTITIHNLNPEHFDSSGDIIDLPEEDKNGQKFYIIKNFTPTEIIDIADLVKKANVGPFNKNYRAILCLDGESTTIKHIKNTGYFKPYISVQGQFLLNQPITVDKQVSATPCPLIGDSQLNILTGSAKLDSIYGGAGNDTIDGKDGNDMLSGGLGDDTLIGGEGKDRLFGGEGDDTYIFEGTWGHDQIDDNLGNNSIIFKNSPQTLNVTRMSGSLLVYTDAKEDGSYNSIKIENEYIDQMAFYNSAKQKYSLSLQRNGDYKLELANK